MSAPARIVLIGAGNVGSRLAQRFADQGYPLLQVFSRSPLKRAFPAPFVNRISDIVPDAEVYLIAVPDDAIADVAAQLAGQIHPGALVAHTSGSTPSAVLSPFFEHFGVCYPLQTFSPERIPDFNEIPVCVDAPSRVDLEVLQQVAAIISPRVYHLDDRQRARVHLAAVFVNNFVNHLYHTGFQLLKEADLPFELLLPLIRETAAKIKPDSDPAYLQTGPARRGDEQTIRRHLEALAGNPEVEQLYQQITSAIQSFHQKPFPHAHHRPD